MTTLEHRRQRHTENQSHHPAQALGSHYACRVSGAAAIRQARELDRYLRIHLSSCRDAPGRARSARSLVLKRSRPREVRHDSHASFYSLDCVCGQRLRSETRDLVCPACGRQIHIEWPAEAEKTASEEQPGKRREPPRKRLKNGSPDQLEADPGGKDDLCYRRDCRTSQSQYTPTGQAASTEKTPGRVRCITKKPPSLESGPRRAHRRDVENSPLKRSACQLYGALCDCLDHTSYTGLAWPKVDTLARRMKVTSRTVQRALDDLMSAGWIGTPFGDAGGPREGVTYHLHPDGKPCLFCVAAERTISQRGGGLTRRTQRVTKIRP